MPERLIPVGAILGVHGVRGWVKVVSHTEPRERILDYRPWQVRTAGQSWREVEVLDGRRQGNRILAQLEQVADREAAQGLVGAEIAVYRSQLPEPASNEFYWADLEGLRVVNVQGAELGRVTGFQRTGANDVMVVTGDREHWVPFVRDDYVHAVDFKAGIIRVDWDPDF